MTSSTLTLGALPLSAIGLAIASSSSQGPELMSKGPEPASKGPELDGKSPELIFKDAEPEPAAPSAISSSVKISSRCASGRKYTVPRPVPPRSIDASPPAQQAAG